MAFLPELTLVASAPTVELVAAPVAPGDDGPALLGPSPVDGLDVAALLQREQAKGDAGELIGVPSVDQTRVVLLGLGDRSPQALRKAGAALVRHGRQSGSLALDLRAVTVTPQGLRALVEGLLLGTYRYTQKPAAQPATLTAVSLVVRGPKGLAKPLEKAVAVVRATVAARDLVNTPPLEKSPAWFASQGKSLLKGLDVRVRDDKQLRAEGWGGVVAVGMGSSRPPRVVEATYDGGGRGAKHVVLVGKGITFDTGGISIKPNDGMLTMKMDMGGAAAVLATVRAAADLKLKLKVTAIACVAENMPSGSAQRPSDVITQYGGTTVEVLNTDAEGRLVLADGIAYADRVLGADVIVDIATLTGAMPIALGKKIAGVFTDHDDLAAELLAAADASGERLWRLPLVADYRPGLDSHTADLRNIGDAKLKLGAGSITAALFLREFAGGRPWAHLDIAGPAWSGGDDDELSKGGTGYGVRLLTTWLEQLSA